MITPAEGISARFIDAGHLLGSASIELTIREEDTEKRLYSPEILEIPASLDQILSILHHADYIVWNPLTVTAVMEKAGIM